ncbi:tail fiber protein [Bengtsoniella intestinalis]|uniref:tail fiber protein n=1 Tax=Bengtsoniella intestinalis TaxID=3073143 RepID=UPI00391EEEAB
MAWIDAVVTNAGAALLAEALAGEEITIDGASGGTGTASASSLLAQTSLVSQKQTFDVVALSDVDGGKKLNIQITSENLSTGYTLNQVGVWAHIGDSDPQLFAIIQDGDGIDIPSETSMPDFSMNFYVVAAVSGEANISLTVDPSGVVTVATMTAAIATLESEMEDALAEKASLDEDGKVPADQLPDMDYIPTDDKGAAGGVAELDEDGKVPTEQLPSMDYIPTSDKGSAGGVAELDSNGTVPSSQLPSYVDDVIEVTDYADLPATGETGKVYVTLDDNKTYRWSGTTCVPIGNDLALGETEATAYRGDRGKIAYDHSQVVTGNPHNVTAAQAGAAPTDHANADATYGAGTGEKYGHVKLSDAVSDTSGASGGTAATPAAVKAAYDRAPNVLVADETPTAQVENDLWRKALTVAKGKLAKERLYRRNADGSYSAVYTETHVGAVVMGDGTTLLEEKLNTTDETISKMSAQLSTIYTAPSQSGTLTYTGSTLTPVWNDYNSEKLTIDGITSGTAVGTYVATFTPVEGYTWEDGTTGAVEVSWSITKASIAYIPSQDGTLTYTGSAQSPVWNDLNSGELTVAGVTSGTNAGTYSATFTPTANYQWPDGTTAAKTVTWTIGRATITATPSQSGTLTYTGSTLTPTWLNYTTAQLTIGGVTSATVAGSYSATFAPTSNYQWSGGSTSAVTVTWAISKAAGSLSLGVTSLALTVSSKTGTISVSRLGDGAISAVSGNTSIATVSVSGTTVTVTAVGTGSTTVTVSVGAGTNCNAPSNASCSVSVDLAAVFGVSWASGSSSTALTRLTTANDPNSLVTVNATTEPSPAVGTGSGSSPFDDYAPWADMEEYNVANSAVTYRRDQTGFSRSSNDVMVYIPEYWFKIEESGTTVRFYISDTEKTGFTKHPGSGKYVARYNTMTGHYSRSGNAPLVSITRATARTGAEAKGTKWSLYDYASWCAVWLLYLVEFADWDSQSMIGRGYVDGSAAQSSGGTDTMTYFTGRAAGTDGLTAVQYRHIENPWGNVREFIDGINFSSRAAYVCTDHDNYADDTSTNYTAAGVTLPSSGWISGLGISTAFPWGFLPDTAGGSETTYIADYVNSATGWTVLNVGGSYSYGSIAGLFYFYASYASSYSNASLGARLLYHP